MSIPDPEPGLVLNYGYLWHKESVAGYEEGRKSRPSVIIVSTAVTETGEMRVTVAPITHSPPSDPNSSIELPQRVKQSLGLDQDRSWVVLSEGNKFLWPGFDLRRSEKIGGYEYGFLPPRFFDRIRQAFVAIHRSGKGKIANRD